MNSIPTNILDLRKQLAERFPEAHRGIPAEFGGRGGCARGHADPVDIPEKGGETTPRFELEQNLLFPKLRAMGKLGLRGGMLTEIVAGRKRGSGASLVHAVLDAAAEQKTYVAIVDGSDSLDVESAGNAVCRRLLWMRCRQAMEAIKAADLILRDGNIPLVLLDLQANTARELDRIPGSTWFRLRNLIESSGVLCLTFTPAGIVSSSHLRVRLASPLLPTTVRLGAHGGLQAMDQPFRETVNALDVEVTRRRRGRKQKNDEEFLKVS